MPNFNDVFRKRLKIAMATADLSVIELADLSGVSVDGIRKYLNGSYAPRFETVCKLSAALGCTPNDLSGIEAVEKVG